jgi:hypothetical protein
MNENSGKTRMKIFVPAYITGQIDLFRFQEFMRPFYPASEIVLLEESLYLLKIHIASGKVLIGKSVNFSVDNYSDGSGCTIYVIEFDDRLEEAIKDQSDIFYKSYKFTINNQDISTSFYMITGEFYAHTFRHITFQEAAKMTRISDIKPEVFDSSGTDFILCGKDRILQDLGGIVTPIIIEEVPPNTDKLGKIELKNETIFVQDRTIFYALKELSHREIIFYTLIAYFYYEQSDLSVHYLKEMRKDIDGLLQGLQIKGSVGWEWEIQELDIKRLNYLKYLSYFRSFDNTFSNVSMPLELKSWYKINKLNANINLNLNAIQFTMTEIDRMVEQKQAALATRRSKNLEYLLTMLGGLGGVGAILAALFAGGLKLETRIIAILLLLFIPLFIVLFEYLVRQGIARRSRKVYLNTKINNLIKAKQNYEVLLKATQKQGKAYPDEYFQFFFTRIKRIEEEIENLSKIK